MPVHSLHGRYDVRVPVMSLNSALRFKFWVLWKMLLYIKRKKAVDRLRKRIFSWYSCFSDNDRY